MYLHIVIHIALTTFNVGNAQTAEWSTTASSRHATIDATLEGTGPSEEAEPDTTDSTNKETARPTIGQPKRTRNKKDKQPQSRQNKTKHIETVDEWQRAFDEVRLTNADSPAEIPPPSVDYFVRARKNLQGTSTLASNVPAEHRSSVPVQENALVAVIERDKGSILGLVLETNKRGWFNASYFERANDWATVNGLSKSVEQSDCSEPGLTPVIAAKNDQVWAWVNNRPCLTRIVQTQNVRSQSSTGVPKPMGTPVLAKVGSTVSIHCPDSILYTPNEGKKVPAFGRVTVLGISKQIKDQTMIVVSQENAIGWVSPACGKNGRIQVANLSERVEIPKAKDSPVLVHFWATWCKPCLKELPAYQRFVDRVGEDRVYAVSVDFTRERAHLYLAKHRYTFPGAIDTEQTTLKRLGGGDVLPFTVVLFPDGQKKEIIGPIEWDEYPTISDLN